MKKLDLKLKEYKDYFKEPFVFSFGETKTEEEVIKEIENCIRLNKKQKLPDYEDGYVY